MGTPILHHVEVAAESVHDEFDHFQGHTVEESELILHLHRLSSTSPKRRSTLCVSSSRDKPRTRCTDQPNVSAAPGRTDDQGFPENGVPTTIIEAE